ncbi:uncharacterized protein LOC143363007 [Halictus rubicundus]|uniref:uncharacterized protein LOC143363007 n=1 Tax=Halictus rubicundus TaxID=77578 RepID=UPI00403674EE
MASSEKGLVIGPRVPRGLAPAVEGLTREILRHRPQDIYTFAAHHFEQLIELRETGRASSNRKCRVLVDWIGPDNKCQPVSDGGSNHDRYRFSVRKRHDSIGETREAIKETTGTTSTKLLTRRRRRRRAAGGEAMETANRNGWSINETVKVFKKHAYENKEKSRNTEKSKRSIEKEIHSYFEQRSPPLSKTAAHCRFHRSWSVEDMHLAKNSNRRFKENQVEPGSIELSVTSRLENGARTCNKSSHSAGNTENISVRRLKRQKSAGQIEDVCSPSHAPSRIHRERVEYIVAPRRTHSLLNVTSNGSCGKEETENISNEIVQGRQSRRESLRGKGIEGKERKKSEEGVTTDTGVDDTREIVAAKLNDSKGIDTVDDTNDEPRFILQEDTSLDNQESVILPSVVTKPCSNSRHSENAAERSENDTNYLILPPIPDASKPIKREDNLVLPVLSKLSEVIELDQQPLKSSGEDRVASIENGKEHVEVDAAVSESQTLQENDYDCRMAVDGTTENEEGSEVIVEIGGNGSNATSDCIELPPTPVKSLEKGNENENEKEKDEERENEIENGSSTTTIGDDQEREQRTCPIGGNDELKSKLIEIETVERNIENTLTSSETVLIAEDDRESVASRPVDCTSESGSEKSSILFGNNLEAACIAGEISGEKAACNTAEGSLCMSENDETDTIPREESNASTVVSSSVEEDGVTMRVDVDDGEQSERARHGSACRDQVSINCSKDVDLSCYVLTEGSPCEIPESVTTVIIPDKSIELQQSDDEIFPDTIEQDTNPFGEYIVYPAETREYSTDNVDLLRDITDAVDRTLAYKDLSNIKEEAEDEEEEKCKSEKDAMRDEVVETRCTADEEISDQLAPVENLPSETTVCADQGRAEATLEDCTTVTEPCVPELNLDSFRDATSSVEDGSETINVENLSEKENDDGDVPREPETTSTSFDTVSPKTKATIDENPLSESRPDPDRPQGENATSSNDCGIDRKDSCNLEEEIARELIEHLTGDSLTLEETDKKSAEGADSFDNATSERATVSTKNPGDPGTQGSSISHGRHTGEFHDSLPLPLPLPFPVPVRESEMSKVRISPMNATVHALERIRDDPVKPSLTPKPDISSFHYESPDTCVLLAFDLPKSLQLIENASNWSTSCVNMPSYIVRVDRDFDGDKVNSLAGERSDSDVNDIREPLALDRTSNSIVIEEILTDDEEEKERSHASRSDDAVDESASSTNFTFENIDFDSEARETTRET